MREDAPQRQYPLREVFNGLRCAVRAGEAWRMMPNDLPPWSVIYQQTRRWMAAGVFEAIVHDLRLILRVCSGKRGRPTAAVIDSRTMRSTPESGGRSGYDGYKRTKGSKVHTMVDTLGHLLTLHITPANEQERDQLKRLAERVQEVTGDNITTLFADQGYTGEADAVGNARLSDTRDVRVFGQERFDQTPQIIRDQQLAHDVLHDVKFRWDLRPY